MQTQFLTADPEITFFKSVYRPYINFAIESIQQTFQGNVQFGSSATVDVDRNGDLITKVLLEACLPRVEVSGNDPTFQWVDNVGNILLEEVSVEIGGQEIDKQFGQWYVIWNQLTLPEEKLEGYNDMIGQQNVIVNATDPSDLVFSFNGLQTPKAVQPKSKLYIPLFFWFNTNSGLALPIIALQYHQVKIKVKFRRFDDLHIKKAASGPVTFVNGTPSLGETLMYIDYIYLDNAERRNYAQNPHEYLITQLQFTGAESISQSNFKPRINFNHPTKELVLVTQENAAVEPNVNQWSNFDTFVDLGGPAPGSNPVLTMQLKVNARDRFSVRDGPYFNLVQPYFHHSRIPKSKGILVYSFALNPEAHQPQGTINFSRIDNAELVLNLSNMGVQNSGKAYIYGINYNLLRIASGQFCNSITIPAQAVSKMIASQLRNWLHTQIQGKSCKSSVLTQYSNVLVAAGKTCGYRYNLNELDNPELRLLTVC